MLTVFALVAVWVILSASLFVYLCAEERWPAELDAALEHGGAAFGVRVAVFWMAPGIFSICLVLSIVQVAEGDWKRAIAELADDALHILRAIFW